MGVGWALSLASHDVVWAGKYLMSSYLRRLMGSNESQSNVSFSIRKGHSHETMSIRYNF